MAGLPPGTPISGNFQIRPEVLLNGQVVPIRSFSVDINAFSLSSALECVVSTAPARGYAPLHAFGKSMQDVRPYPFEIRCGYSRDGSGSPMVLEKGYVDERETEYAAQEIRFTGRGEASLFQDIQIGDPLDRSQAGSAVVQAFFRKYAPHIQLAPPPVSPVFAGTTPSEADPVYATTMRDRTAWDEMQAIALADGYRLTVHAGKATYGPPVGDPVLKYDWRGDGKNEGLIALNVRHSPRRSHNIKVVVRSILPHAKSSFTKSYGSANAKEGETFHFTIHCKSRGDAQKQAQHIWEDVAKREFLCTATIVPDELFMQTISQVGSNFSVVLGGAIDPAENITYIVRQARLNFSSGSGLPLTATLIMGNVNPIQEGASLS